MVAVPEITDLDMAFGNVKHLPPSNEIPDVYNRGHTRWNKLTSKWFFSGLDQGDIGPLVPKPGVDKRKALRALGAILRSWEPKHEHKEAGVAYLFSEWFEDGPTENCGAAPKQQATQSVRQPEEPASARA